MKPPSKTMIIVMIAVILLFVIIAAILPDREVTEENANLIVVSATDVPIGSIGVNYNLWDGTLSSECATNADGTMMERGSKVSFVVEAWPATLYIYADLQGSRILETIVIESAPENGGAWTATVVGGEGNMSIHIH